MEDMPARFAQSAFDTDELVCWSRMQGEAGQPLETIVARKERERRAGNGLYFWGVGNAPSTAINALARAGREIPAIFSIMKTPPKAHDLAPARTVVWRRYIDCYGIERALPPHALVTSRGDSAAGPKRAHYALICRSDAPLQIRDDEAFDPLAYCNASGKPVGASQVTALLRRIGQPSKGSQYRVNLRASLTGSLWVRLTDPLELSAEKVDALRCESPAGEDEWVSFVTHLRSGPSAVAAQAEAQGSLELFGREEGRQVV